MLLRVLLVCLLQSWVLSIPIGLAAKNRLQHYVAKAQYGISQVRKDNWLMDFHMNSDPSEKENGYKVILEGTKIPNKDQMLSFLDGTTVDSMGALFSGNFALFDTNHYGYELFKRLQNGIQFSKVLNNKEHELVSTLLEPLVGKEVMRFLVSKITTAQGDSITDYTFHVWTNSKDKDNSMFCISKGQTQSCAMINKLTTIKMVPLDSSEKLTKRLEVKKVLKSRLQNVNLFKRLDSVKSSVSAYDINSLVDFARVNKDRIQAKAENAMDSVTDAALEIARESKSKIKSVKQRIKTSSVAFIEPESFEEKFRPAFEYDPYDVSHMSSYLSSSESGHKPPVDLYRRGATLSPRTRNYTQILL